MGDGDGKIISEVKYFFFFYNTGKVITVEKIKFIKTNKIIFGKQIKQVFDSAVAAHPFSF